MYLRLSIFPAFQDSVNSSPSKFRGESILSTASRLSLINHSYTATQVACPLRGDYRPEFALDVPGGQVL